MAQRYYRNLDCENYQQINSEISTWVANRNIVENARVFWNPIDTLDFMKSNKEFQRWCRQQNLKIRDVVVTVLKKDWPLLRPHTDTPPARFKLSWPILNASTTWNRWYEVEQDSADYVKNDYNGISYTDISQLREIARRQLIGPSLIDASVIHDVEVSDDQNYPRVGLQCQLFNEPTEL